MGYLVVLQLSLYALFLGQILQSDGEPLSRTRTALPDQCSTSESKTLTNFQETDDGASVLLVLDPNFRICTEKVDIDPFTNRTLLSWVYTLRDALTYSKSHPNGLHLRVSPFLCFNFGKCLGSLRVP